jgi:hypothetical protein
LTQPVTVQLQFGKVTLNPGTRLRLIAIEGTNLRANFNNNIVLVPVASTDVDPATTIVVQNPATTAPTVVPTAPAPVFSPPAPAATSPPVATKPSSPSADL